MSRGHDKFPDFNGKNVVVTGAAQGLGAAIAALFALSGATVFACDIRPHQISETDGDLRARHLDVTSEASWMALADEIGKSGDAVSVLVNNAGIILRKSIAEASLFDWNSAIAVNVTGAFLGIVAAFAATRRSGFGGQCFVNRRADRAQRCRLHDIKVGTARIDKDSRTGILWSWHPSKFGSPSHNFDATNCRRSEGSHRGKSLRHSTRPGGRRRGSGARGPFPFFRLGKLHDRQ
jgi:hypothetical protein